MYKTFLYLLILLAFSCTKIEIKSIENLNNGKIEVIGHGGCGFQSLIQPLPTNSFISVQKAVDALNADGVELDLQASEDSILILYHDTRLEHSTNCVGCVRTEKSTNLLDCKYKNHYGSRAQKDEHLVTLQSIIDYFKSYENPPKFYLSSKVLPCDEVANTNYAQLYSYLINEIISKNKAEDWLYFSDSNPELLNNIKILNPDIDLYYTAQTFEDGLTTSVNNNYTGFLIKTDYISKEQLAQAHINNLKVVLWGVITQKASIDAIEKNPDGIMTDNIPLLHDILKNI